MMKFPAWGRDISGVRATDLSEFLTPRYTIKSRSGKVYWNLPGFFKYELFLPMPNQQVSEIPQYQDFFLAIMNELSGLEKQVKNEWGIVFLKNGEEKNVHIFVWAMTHMDMDMIKTMFKNIYSKFLVEYESSFDKYFKPVTDEMIVKGYPYANLFVNYGTSAFMHLSKFELALNEKVPLISNAEYMNIPLKRSIIIENLLLNMNAVKAGATAIFTMTFKSAHIRIFGDRHYERRLKSADLSSTYVNMSGDLVKVGQSPPAVLLNKNYMEKMDSPYHFIVVMYYATFAANEKELLKYSHEAIFNSINGFFTQTGNYFKHRTYLERSREELRKFFAQKYERKFASGDSVLSARELAYFFPYPTMDMFYHGGLQNVEGMNELNAVVNAVGSGSSQATAVPESQSVPASGGEIAENLADRGNEAYGNGALNVEPEPVSEGKPEGEQEEEMGAEGGGGDHAVKILDTFKEGMKQINPKRKVTTIVLSDPSSPSQLVYNITAGVPIHGIAVGSTGSGKSSTLINIFLQLAKDENAVLFYLDPIGRDIIDNILPNLTKEQLKRVVLISPESEDTTIGMNILAPQELALIENIFERSEVESKIKSEINFQGTVLQKVGEDIFETFKYITESSSGTGGAYVGSRILTNVTKGIKVVGMWKNANLVDLSYLFTFKNSRQKLKSMVSASDTATLGFLELLGQYKPDELHSTVRLIDQIVDSEPLRRILCTRNFKASVLKFINEKKIVLVNGGSATLGQNSMRILLSSMLSMIWVATTSPMRDRDTSIYVFADEFQEYANSSMKMMLDMGRKWAVSLFLATTSLASMKNLQLRNSIMSNAQIRMLFRLGADDMQLFRNEGGQLVVQNSTNLAPFRMIAKTPNTRYGIYVSPMPPKEHKVSPQEALNIVLANSKQYVVPDDTRESILFDPNDLFAEIALVLLHTEGKYIQENRINEASPEYMDKAFATSRNMVNMWNMLAQVFPDTYTPLDARNLYLKLMQGIQRGLFSQMEFAGSTGKEMGYRLTERGEIFLMEWLGSSAAGKLHHRKLIIDSIKYLVRRGLVLRLIKQGGVMSPDIEAAVTSSAEDRGIFMGRERVFVEVEYTPSNVIKKLERGINADAFVIFITDEDEKVKEIYREIHRYEAEHGQEFPAHQGIDSYYSVIKLNIEKLSGSIMVYNSHNDSVIPVSQHIYSSEHMNILQEVQEESVSNAVPEEVTENSENTVLENGSKEDSVYENIESEIDQKVKSSKSLPEDIEDSFIYLLKVIPYSGNTKLIRVILNPKNFLVLISDYYSKIYNVSSETVGLRLKHILNRYIEKNYIINNRIYFNGKTIRIYIVSPALYSLKTKEYPELKEYSGILSSIYIDNEDLIQNIISKFSNEYNNFIFSLDGFEPVESAETSSVEPPEPDKDNVDESKVDESTKSISSETSSENSKTDEQNQPVKACPDSLWLLGNEKINKKVENFLFGKKFGEELLRAYRELGYRDFFGLCLGLTSCFNNKSPTDRCGKLILEKYQIYTGVKELVNVNWRYRDPEPSFNFAKEVFGSDFCIDGELIDLISSFIDFIAEDLCAINKNFCNEILNYRNLKNLKSRTMLVDDKNANLI